MEWRQPDDETSLFFASLRRHMRRSGGDGPALKVPDGLPLSTGASFIYLPTIQALGVEALSPSHDPIYCGRLPACGGGGRALGPIKPPRRAEDIWLQASRYGEGIALEDLVDYIMDQLPPRAGDHERSRDGTEAQAASPESTQLTKGPFWLVVEPSLAVATIDKIMHLHLLHCNTTRGEVVALVHYYIKCFIQERQLSLPYLPTIDRGLFCFWKPKGGHL